MAVAVEGAPPGATPSSSETVRQPMAGGASALAVIWLLIALAVTVLLLYRGNVIGGWDWPGVDSVKLTQATNHLRVYPFPTPITIGQDSVDGRAIDVVYTSAMTAISGLSGVGVADLIRLPAGICLYLLGSLFLIRSVSRGLKLNLPVAYTLAAAIVCASIYWTAVLWILDEDPFGWFLLLVSWGLLVRCRCTPLGSRDAVFYTVLWVAVALTMNYTYPTVMTVNLIACCSVLAYSLLRALVAWLRRDDAGLGLSAAEGFLGTAMIVIVAFTLHPVFDNAVGVLKTPQIALATLIGFFHRAAGSPYEAFVGMSPLTLRVLLLQVAVLAAFCFVARLLGEWQARSWRPFGPWPVLDGLFLTAIIMPVLAVTWGDSRVFEAAAILMPLTACVLIATPSRPRMRVAVGGALVFVSLAAGIAFARDPAGLRQSGIPTATTSAGTWAGKAISGSYFADLEVLNPALMANPQTLADAPVVSQSDIAPVAGFYPSADSLANRLLIEGYPTAMFTERDFTLRISLADYPVAPINRSFVFDSGRFNQVYDNGDAGAFVVLPPHG